MRVLDTSDALESTDCTNCTGGGTDNADGTCVCTLVHFVMTFYFLESVKFLIIVIMCSDYYHQNMINIITIITKIIQLENIISIL